MQWNYENISDSLKVLIHYTHYLTIAAFITARPCWCCVDFSRGPPGDRKAIWTQLTFYWHSGPFFGGFYKRWHKLNCWVKAHYSRRSFSRTAALGGRWGKWTEVTMHFQAIWRWVDLLHWMCETLGLTWLGVTASAGGCLWVYMVEVLKGRYARCHFQDLWIFLFRWTLKVLRPRV